LASQLVERYGVLTREMVTSEGVSGGFSTVYPVLKAMEEAGRIRRGYFVAGLGAAQFAASGAEDQLREPIAKVGLDDERREDSLLILAATDPANPYGSALRWPATDAGTRPQRVAGARVILYRGELLGYLGRKGQHLRTFLPNDELARAEAVENLMRCFTRMSHRGEIVYLKKVNGGTPHDSVVEQALRQTGFAPSTQGYLLRVAAE
jgi:ATP-dependent Lhr-like helicase